MKSMKHLIRVLGGIAAAGVLVATVGCSTNSSEPAPSDNGSSVETPATPDKIVIATPTAPGNPAGVPAWIGEKNGYFAEENLEVEVVTFPGRPSDAVATVVSGQADLVISVPDALIAPTAGGDDLGLSWIFTPYQRPSFVIAVTNDSDIDTAADLEGKTVALPALGAPYETFMRSNVSGEGGDPDTIRPVALQAIAALESLRTGEVDAVVLNRGDLAHAVEVTDFDIKDLPLAADVADGIAAGFMMRSDSTAEERDIYTRYLRAYTKSAVFAQENPKAAIEMSWEIYPETRPADSADEGPLVAMLGATVNEFMPAEDGGWGFISQERWEKYVANLGFSEQLPDVTILYDYSLLDGIADFDADEVRADAQAMS